MKKSLKIILLCLFCTLLCGGFFACDKLPSSTVCEHTYGEWITVQERTCEEVGFDRRGCSLCGEVETKYFAPLGHDMGEWITTVEADCGGDGLCERYCTRCRFTETETIPKKPTHELIEYERTEPTCVTDGKSLQRCACAQKTASVRLPSRGGHTDDNEDLTCDFCLQTLWRIPVELLCEGNATATVAQDYVLLGEEGGAKVDVTMGENSIMYACHLLFPPREDDPSFIGGNQVTLRVDFIDMDDFESLTSTYRQHISHNPTFGTPVKIRFTIKDTTKTAVVAVAARAEQNETGFFSSQYSLYWGNLVDEKDDEAMSDPANIITVPAKFVKDTEKLRVELSHYTDEEGNILSTEDNYQMVATKPITYLSIYYVYEQKGDSV